MRLANDDDHDAIKELQEAAYAQNRELLGLEPLPLQTPVDEILEEYEVWLLEGDEGLLGVLVLEPRAKDMLVWSVAVAPEAQRKGIGKLMMDTAELRARQFGHGVMRLYTGSKLAHLIDWYKRLGYEVERSEKITDREITHMVKQLGPAA